MNKILNTHINLMLLLLGVFCQTEMLLQTLNCPVSSFFYLWLALVCFGLWYTAHSQIYNWAGIVLTLLLLFLLWYTEKPDILLQLNDFFDRIAGLITERYLRQNEPYPSQNIAITFDFLFLSFGFLECAYLTIALVSKGARTDLVFLGTLPFTVFCVTVSDRPPLIPLLGIVLFWFLTAVGGSFYRKESGSGMGVLLSLLPLIALLAVLLLFVNPDTYEYQEPKLYFSEQFSAIQNFIQQLAKDLPDENIEILAPAPIAPSEYRQNTPTSSSQQIAEQSVGIMWQNADGEMDLTQGADASMLDTVFLKVRSMEDGILYLRALSFGDYTGTSWLPAEENVTVSALTFTAEALAASGIHEKQLNIEAQITSRYRFLPYFSRETTGFDSYVSSQSGSRYTASYYPGIFTSGIPSLPIEYVESELTYRQYVQTYYTRLPDSTRSALSVILEENGLKTSNDPVSAIADFVQHTAQYDITARSYPADDYALYFLTQAQRGYCIHFATAAVALYRAAGIPARITEGFLLRAEAGRTVEVTGTDAHAWVEIYQDGLGWLPVEVTGQSGLQEEATVESQPFSPDADAAQVSPPLPSVHPVTSETSLPAPADSPVDNAASSEENIISSAEEDPASEDGFEEIPVTPALPSPTPQLPVGIISEQLSEEKQSINLFWFLSLPITAVILLPIVRFYLRRRKKPDPRSVVIAAYSVAMHLSRLSVPVSPQIRNCAEKAVFSRNGVTIEEADACREELSKAISALETEGKCLQKIKLKLLRYCSFWHYPWLGL